MLWFLILDGTIALGIILLLTISQIGEHLIRRFAW